METKLSKFVQALLLASVVVTSVAACGGGSGSGSDENTGNSIVFSGTVSDGVASTRASRQIAGVEVCALGSCAVTDANGAWLFTAPAGSLTGEDVLFTLSQQGSSSDVVLMNLLPSSEAVTIDFFISDDGSSGVLLVTQDGMPTEDNEPNGGQDDLSGLSESERACQIIERSNITTIDSVSMISSMNAMESCPEEIPAIITVANPGTIAFEYSVTVDLGAINVAPLTGVLAPGESQSHDGTYDCSSDQSFNTLLNAVITRYLPEGSEPITADDALNLCGAGASTGNTIISSEISVDIVQ